jgi:hypothetical protein
MDIEQKLAELKLAREVSTLCKSEMNYMIEAAKLYPQYRDLSDKANLADDAIATLEAELRGLALDEYEATKNKTPFEKVTIKIFKTFRIVDVERVKEWAWNNLPAAFKLDEAKIKTYSNSFGEVPGTESGEEARAQIASEL